MTRTKKCARKSIKTKVPRKKLDTKTIRKCTLPLQNNPVERSTTTGPTVATKQSIIQ